MTLHDNIATKLALDRRASANGVGSDRVVNFKQLKPLVYPASLSSCTSTGTKGKGVETQPLNGSDWKLFVKEEIPMQHNSSFASFLYMR